VTPLTPGQQRALTLLLGLAILYAAFRLATRPTTIADPIPSGSDRYLELADRIDPNTADVATLAALPNLGERRAREVVAFRERRAAIDPARPAFARPDDLLQVRGIGVTLVRQLEPYLTFPATTRPTS